MTETPSKPSRIPLMLSALVCPGIGQFVQRRWVAGICYLASFLVFFAAVNIQAASVLKQYYSLMYDGTDITIVDLPIGRMGLWLLLGIVAYVANLVDVYRAYRRAYARANPLPLPDMPHE